MARSGYADFLPRSMGHLLCRSRCGDAVKVALRSTNFLDALQYRSITQRAEAVLHVLDAQMENLVKRGVSATSWELGRDMDEMAAAINEFLNDEEPFQNGLVDFPFYADLVSVLQRELALAATFLVSLDLPDDDAVQASEYTNRSSTSGIDLRCPRTHTHDAHPESNDLLEVLKDEEVNQTHSSDLREEIGKTPTSSTDNWIVSAIGRGAQEVSYIAIAAGKE